MAKPPPYFNGATSFNNLESDYSAIFFNGMKKFIVLNWKMAPASSREAEKIFNLAQKGESNSSNGQIKKTEIVAAPPFVYLSELIKSSAKSAGGLHFAAQDVFWENPKKGGAFTGEISPQMLKNLGAEYVIIGHSERRRILAETDAMINKKVSAALNSGLKVILCIGELFRNLKNQSKGLREAKEFVFAQIKNDLKNLKSLTSRLKSDNFIIAYEPVWAIGTGNNDTPQNAVEMAEFIKKSLVTNGYLLKYPPVLYGGSVNSRNISVFIGQPEIDGVLIGRSSVEKKELANIFKQINKSSSVSKR